MKTKSFHFLALLALSGFLASCASTVPSGTQSESETENYAPSAYDSVQEKLDKMDRELLAPFRGQF